MMLIGAAAAFGVAAVLTPLLARWARGRGLLDVPNSRSSHEVPTPRIGGVALVIAVIVGFAISHNAYAESAGRLSTSLIVAVAMGTLGLVDDLRPLSALLRLLLQAGIAVGGVAVLGGAALPWVPSSLSAALTAFWIVALTNAFNFMDGVDGIAAGQAVVAGLAWAVVGEIAGWRDTALLAAVTACAGGGFLLHNWQPARVFMGDAGSAFLGCLFALLPLTAPAGARASTLVGLLLMWPFLFDTGFTLVRRLRRGENVLAAHRSHLYQRLTLTGTSHKGVAAVYAALATLGASAAILLAAARLVPASLLAATIPVAAFCLWRAVELREALDRTKAPRP